MDTTTIPVTQERRLTDVIDEELPMQDRRVNLDDVYYSTGLNPHQLRALKSAIVGLKVSMLRHWMLCPFGLLTVVLRLIQK